MRDSMETRKYVQQMILSQVSTLKAASEAMGHNHAYLQQYVAGRSPETLGERERDYLVKQFGIDADRLKPTPVALLPKEVLTAKGVKRAAAISGARQVKAENSSDLQELSSEELLMRLWRRLSPAMQRAVLSLIRAYATDITESSKRNNV